jgi:deoxyribodipyrimidine photolyase-related protein
MFLTSPIELMEFVEGRSMFIAAFYKEQRKRMKILVHDGEPVGGQVGFDAENRKKLPRNIELPTSWRPKPNSYIADARSRAAARFLQNGGDVNKFDYPNNLSGHQTLARSFRARAPHTVWGLRGCDPGGGLSVVHLSLQ